MEKTLCSDRPNFDDVPKESFAATDESSEMSSEQDGSNSVLFVPQTKIEEAYEFRKDSIPSTTPVAAHFFCCVCGCPAGADSYTCGNRGHPVCKLCKEELKIYGCPFVVSDKEKLEKVCGYKLNQVKSTFHEFMFANTMVGCRYRTYGCNFQGPWENVKKHQEVCGYAG